MYYDGINEDGYPTISVEEDNLLADYQLAVLSENGLPTYVFNSFWVYKYRLDLCGEEILEVGKWAEENLKNEFLIGCSISGIVDEEDAILFKLTWGCCNCENES